MADVEKEQDATAHRKVRTKDVNGGPLIDGEEVRSADVGRGDEEKTTNGQNAEGKNEKPSKFKEIWGKLGLDIGTVMMMFKGSVSPFIAIAFYQSDAVSRTYATLGYLVAIVTVLSTPIMPRAKFIQTMILNLIGICLGSAIAILGVWSGVKAREHTTPAGTIAAYNSSQAAVCAIWLFANIWFVNTLRAKMPALQFPVIMYSIFTNVAFTYGPIFQTIAQGEALIKQLLISFLTAFALATAVNLLVIPMSSRLVVNKEQSAYVGLVRATLAAQTAYLQSLESTDMFDGAVSDSEDLESRDKSNKKTQNKSKKDLHPAETTQSEALKGAVAGLTALHGKLHGDLPFAKREIAWGKLDANDLDEIFMLFRGIVIPLIGMSTISDIFERIAERRGWIRPTNPHTRDQQESWERCTETQKLEEKKVWNAVMKTLHEPFSVAVKAMDEGMEHAGIILEILPRPKKKKVVDEESKGADPLPGDAEFTQHMEKTMKDFYTSRGEVLKAWAREKGLSEEQFDTASPHEERDFTPTEAQHRRDQQQLYLILYLEHLLYSAGTAVTALVRFADKKVADGTMSKNRLIVPGQRRIWKWIVSIGKEDTSVDTESPDSLEAGNNHVYMGPGFNPKKDPEHLPPKTGWQRFGNGIRIIPRFLGSTESAFGFRVACATLTIGIIGFLEDTQKFFIEQRLVWAMIIIAIGMSMTSGQSFFGFFGRCAGTAIATVTSIVIWYIVDQKTWGIIIMLWFFIFLEMYFFVKFPRFIPVWLVAIVTQVLIVGYELQVRKIGSLAAAASGQPVYRIYLLAPYRLACVAGGSFVAFIWTIFPYPLSDRTWIRKDLGSTLYLLANYYSVVHATIGARIRGDEGSYSLKSSPGRQLQKARYKIFNKLLLLLPSLKQHADWQKWELTVGGKFPRETYDAITLRATNIMNYLSLITYATQYLSQSEGEGDANGNGEGSVGGNRQWLHDLGVLVDSVGSTSHQITSILSLLSASVQQGAALPPHIQLPEPYNLNRKLEALDRGILDARHVAEPGYSAYAVLQVASSLITDDLARLVDHVKDLVGETDFSFTVQTSDSSLDSNSSDSSDKGKRD